MLFKRRIKIKKKRGNSCRNTYLFDCLEAGNFTVHCMEGKQRAKKGKREGTIDSRVSRWERLRKSYKEKTLRPFVSSEL